MNPVSSWNRQRPNRRPNRMVIAGPRQGRQNWGEGWRVCDFSLIGWWWGNRALCQESCPQPEVTIFHLGGAPSSAEELKDIVMHTPWGGTRTLCQGCSTTWLLLPCFCIPSSLPRLATVWICPLELRKDQGGWMKPTNKNQGTQKGFVLQSPTEHCSVSIQGNRQQWLWSLPAKMGHSPASIWRIITELEIFLSQVLDLSLVWLKSQSLGLPFWCNRPN